MEHLCGFIQRFEATSFDALRDVCAIREEQHERRTMASNAVEGRLAVQIMVTPMSASDAFIPAASEVMPSTSACSSRLIEPPTRLITPLIKKFDMTAVVCIATTAPSQPLRPSGSPPPRDHPEHDDGDRRFEGVLHQIEYQFQRWLASVDCECNQVSERDSGHQRNGSRHEEAKYQWYFAHRERVSMAVEP